jgi:hypothetical protein
LVLEATGKAGYDGHGGTRSFIMTDDLWERIELLEREKRLWKRVATAALSALAILLLLGAGLGVLHYQSVQMAHLRAARAAAEAQAQRDAAQRALDAVRRGDEKKP